MRLKVLERLATSSAKQKAEVWERKLRNVFQKALVDNRIFLELKKTRARQSPSHVFFVLEKFKAMRKINQNLK